MSIVRAASVLSVVVLAFSAFSLAAGEREATNIVPNAGAEKAGADKLPEGWSQYRNTPAEVGRSEKVYHSGKSSAYMKITTFRGDDTVNAGLAVGLTSGWDTGSEKAIPVKPNTKYYFSFYIKGGGFTRKISVVPWGFKADGTGRDRNFPLVGVVPTEKWTQYTGSFTTKAETERVVLMFHVFGARDRDLKKNAILFVDDMYLGTSEATAKAEVPAADQPKQDMPVFVPIKEYIEPPPGTPIGYEPVKPGMVRIWDTNKKYEKKRPSGSALKDRPKWSPVPYGKTDYQARGDIMLENEYFYLFCFTNKGDSISFLPKKPGGKGEIYDDNEIYKVFQNKAGRRDFGMGTISAPKILKYTEKEIVIEHAGKAGRSDEPVTTSYRVQGGKCWLEVGPVNYVNQQGMHGKSRICAFVRKDHDEFILDGKRATWPGKENNVPAPSDTIGIINFKRGLRGVVGAMTFLTSMPGFEKSKLTYLGFHIDRFWEDWLPHDSPSCGAQYVQINGKAVIAALNYKSVWEREDIVKSIASNESYTSKFAAPYPGKWRVIGFVVTEKDYKPRERVATRDIPESYKTPIEGKYYYSTVEITEPGEKFTFKSPVAGTLDYLLIYLNDRTENTPKGVFTPMGVYREAILGEEAKDTESKTAP
ncbi:MAG: carbohydrate binding domain-containing protein [Planctomycetota bacterium]|nr:carbohydrate binding domain-containing protein [Planctomycetota bacterium]